MLSLELCISLFQRRLDSNRFLEEIIIITILAFVLFLPEDSLLVPGVCSMGLLHGRTDIQPKIGRPLFAEPGLRGVTLRCNGQSLKNIVRRNIKPILYKEELIIVTKNHR